MNQTPQHCTASYKEIASKRNKLLNLLLSLIQIISTAIVLLFFFSGALFRIFEDPTDSFNDVYGKGQLPVFLICLSLVFCNHLVLKGRKSGFYAMPILLFLCVFPLIWNEYDEFIFFYTCGMLVLFVYFLLLQLRKKGKSAWELCKPSKHLPQKSVIVMVGIYLTTCFIFPPLAGYAVGFKAHYFSNGCNFIDARLNKHAFYSSRLATIMAFGGEYEAERYEVEKWYKHAIQLEIRERSSYPSPLVDYMIYLITEKDQERALEVYEKACDIFSKAEVDEYIELDAKNGFSNSDIPNYTHWLKDELIPCLYGQKGTPTPETISSEPTQSAEEEMPIEDEETPNAPIAQGMYTLSGSGRSQNTGAYTDNIGNREVKVVFYPDYITVDDVYCEYLGEAGYYKKYDGQLGQTYYVNANYDMYMSSYFTSPMGSDTFIYQMTKYPVIEGGHTPSTYPRGNSNLDNRQPVSQLCRACKGHGRCPICKGIGRTKTRRFYNSDLGVWDLKWEVCNHCGGTGRCPACNGDGYLDEGSDF